MSSIPNESVAGSPIALLDQARTFPPRRGFLFVWIGTGLFATFGAIVSFSESVTMVVIWAVILLVSLRQVWTTRWYQLDRDGIRSRNIFGRGREISWSGVTEVAERHIPMRKEKFFGILKITGRDLHRGGSTTITIDNDTQNYPLLQEILKGSIPDERWNRSE